jgi:hypothetical protein
MYSDSRVVNKQGNYCLCTRCTKANVYPGEVSMCVVHDEFIKMTTQLFISAPIFACHSFSERVDDPDYLGRAIDDEPNRQLNEEIKYLTR